MIRTNLEYCNNRMKGDVMQISKEELQSSSIPLAKALEEISNTI